MANDYYIDLERYKLSQFKQELKVADLLPSRQILRKDIDKRFKILKEIGVQNLQDIVNSLKTPKKTKEFAEKSGLNSEYLLILRREVNSYLPKPVNLEKFPGIKKDTISKLNDIGIKNSLHLFKIIKFEADRNQLATEIGVNNKEILELTKLTDLNRVKWIGPVFARIFLESGTDTVEKLSTSNAETLYKKIIEINKQKGYTKAKFVENDVKLCIDISKMVPKVIQY
jgi:hypothetical protein